MQTAENPFVASNLIFVLYNEIGNVTIYVTQLPIFGQEADADNMLFAAMIHDHIMKKQRKSPHKMRLLAYEPKLRAMIGLLIGRYMA